MPFIFTISNEPLPGDEVIVTLTDGDDNTEAYGYTAVEGDTAQDVVDALMSLINADVYFVAIPQTTYAQPGLSISQVTNNNYGGFSGFVTITLSEDNYSPAQTITFDEESNRFESFLSLKPEMYGVLGNLLISYSGGDLYTHDSETYNNFFGVQYESSITVAFNDQPAVKKTFNAVGFQSSVIWASPTTGDIYTSGDNPQTGLAQQSQLKSVDFEEYENVWSAAYLRDANSMANAAVALLEGDYLKGTILFHKFVCPSVSAANLVEFVKPYCTWSPSGRNF